MDDLIRRADLLEVFKKFPAKNDAIPKNAVEALIKDAPVADNVVHAKWYKIDDWFDNNNAWFECTNCHHGDIHAKSVEAPYCWYCGAKMDGKEGGAV